MKQYLYIGFIIFLAGMLHGCYEDKGNYEYEWVKEVNAKFHFKDTSVRAGAILRIEPVIRSLNTNDYNWKDTLDIFNNQESYTYRWEAWDTQSKFIELLSEKHTLDTAINLAIKNQAYKIIFKVKEKASGVEWNAAFNLKVTDAFSKGIVFLYADAENAADIDVYGTAPTGERFYQRRILSSAEYPYRGKPHYIMTTIMTTLGTRIWFGTDDRSGYIIPPTFEWQDNYLLDIYTVGEKGIKYTKFIQAGERFFVTDDGRLSHMKASGSSLQLFAPMNLLPPSLSLQDSGVYESVEFAPYVTGTTTDNFVWDKTNKRFLTFSGGSNASGSERPAAIQSPNPSFLGYEMVYMSNWHDQQQFSVVLQKPESQQYIMLRYNYVPGTRKFTYQEGATQDIINTNNLIETAKFLRFISSSNLLAATDNKIYVYKDYQGFVQAASDIPFGEITCIKTLNSGDYRYKLLVAGYNETEGKGTLYVFETNSVTPENMELIDTIEDTPKIVDITYF